MGQRHQIYVRLPKIDYGNGNPNNLPERTIGIHHQWLYGYTAVRLLRNYFTYWTKEHITHRHTTDGSSALELLSAVYSVDPDRAYFHGVHKLDQEEINNPRRAGNNNGITVIDFTGARPKYCFMSLGYLETLHESVQHPDDPEDGQAIAYRNFCPIHVTDWVKLHYGVDWSVQWRDSPTPSIQQQAKDVNDLVDFVSSFDLLNVEELCKIFPGMVDGNGLNPTPNSLKFMGISEKIAVRATVGVQKRVKKVTPRKPRRKSNAQQKTKKVPHENGGTV